MLVVHSHNGVPIRLTEERWQHILTRHPEMIDHRGLVERTVAEPDIIQQGDFGELLAVRFHPQTSLTSKFIVVAYREVSSGEGYILTAYLTSRPSPRRDTVWKR